MMDRDKVIKGLELCLGSIDSAGCPEGCPYYEACKKYENRVVFQPLMRDALEALKKEPPSGEWIRVEDRLPEKGVMVITAIYGSDLIIRKDDETLAEAVERTRRTVRRTSAGFLDEDGYWCGAEGWPEVVQPSYWMPMPKPPAAEG